MAKWLVETLPEGVRGDVEASTLPRAIAKGGEWALDWYDVPVIYPEDLDAEGIDIDHPPSQRFSLTSPSGEVSCHLVFGEEAILAECEEGHDWDSPHDVVGGIRVNPGVWGGIGTELIIEDFCPRCRCHRVRVGEPGGQFRLLRVFK